jgi:hypothetical protein
MCILLHKSRIKTQIVFTFPAPGARNWADAGTHTHHTPSTMRKSSLSLRASPKVLPPFNSRRSLPACTHNTLGRLHSFPPECTIFLTFLTVHFPLRPVGQGLFCREEISYAAGCCGGVRSLPRGEVPQQFKFMQIR